MCVYIYIYIYVCVYMIYIYIYVCVYVKLFMRVIFEGKLDILYLSSMLNFVYWVNVSEIISAVIGF